MLKIYESILDKQLYTTINVLGRDMRIGFVGGDTLTNGVFITSDENIQNAIESAPGFNKYFKLVRTSGEKTTKKEVKVDAYTKPKPNPLPKSKVDFTFKTVMEAKSFFSKEPYNIPTSRLTVASAVIEEAKALGLNVEFKR